MKTIILRKTKLERVALLLAIPFVYTLLLIRQLVPTDAVAFGGDALLPFHPDAHLGTFSHSFNWWGDFSSPLPSLFSFGPILDNTVFLILLRGLNLNFAQAFYAYLLIISLVSTISIYYLVSAIFSNREHGFMISIVVSTVYLFNPILFSGTFQSILYEALQKALFYLLIAMVVRGFQQRSLNYALIAAVVSFGTFTPTPVGTYHRMIFFAAFYLLLGTYIIVRKKHGKGRAIRFWLIFGSVFSALALLVNLYWLFPYVAHLGEYVQLAATNPLNFFFNKWSNIINTVRMLNVWGFWAGYVPYAEVYSTNIILVITTFLWPLLAFSALLLSPRDKKVLTLSIVTVITLFFAKGNNPPFGSIYVDFVSLNIFGIYPFKAFYTTGTITRHVLTIEYSILVGYTITEASRRLHRVLVLRSQKGPHCTGIVSNSAGASEKLSTVLLLTLLMTPIIASSWPLPTGEVMINYYPFEKFGVKYYGVKIPEDYVIANELIMNDAYESDYHPFMVRALVLPKMYTYIATRWYYQGTSSFYNFNFEIPTVTGNSIPYDITISGEAIDKIFHLPFKPYDMSHSLRDISMETTLNLMSLLDPRTVKAWQIGDISLTNESIYVTGLEGNDIMDHPHLDFSTAFNTSVNLMENNFLKLETTTDISRENVWIGLGDSGGNVGWWRSDMYILESTGLIDTHIMPLHRYHQGNLDLSNVKSLHIRIEPPRRGNMIISNILCTTTKTETIIPKELSWISFHEDLILKDANYNTYWAINTSSYRAKWHQIRLQLPWTQNWQSYDYLRIRLNETHVDLSKLRIGIADENGFVGWYGLKEYMDPYVSSNSFQVANIPIMQVQDLSTFNVTSVTDVWLGYYVEEYEPDEPKVLISDMYVCKAEVDVFPWAERLASHNIGYVIVDKSVIEGTPGNLFGNASYYTGILGQSKYFKEVFASDNLLIFRNEIFKDEIKILPEHAAVIEDSYFTPTRIIVRINASDDFEIALPAIYSEGWCAWIVENASETRLPDSLHFRAQEIFNGWSINKTGSFEIKLDYEPQNRFYFGLMISVITLLACLAYPTYSLTRNKAIWKRTKPLSPCM